MPSSSLQVPKRLATLFKLYHHTAYSIAVKQLIVCANSTHMAVIQCSFAWLCEKYLYVLAVYFLIHFIEYIQDFETFNKIRLDDEEAAAWQKKGLELIGSFYLLLGGITKTAQIA